MDDDQSSVVLADGIGLLCITADSLIETVEQSKTVHEVQHSIGLDRQEILGC